MHIGLDITSAMTQTAGIGRYTRELIRALFALDSDHTYTLFYASQKRLEPPFDALPRGVRLRRLPFHDRWLARIWHKLQLPIPVELITGRIDLFHSPDFTLPPTLPRTRTLLTVHDLSFMRDPDSAVPALRRFLEKAVSRSVARAQRVLADSQATKDDLVSLFGTPSEKIEVLLSGVDTRFQPIQNPTALAAVRAKYNLGNDLLVLSVGTIQPRKNYTRLIQAFAQVVAQWDSAQRGQLTLVIAGGKGWMFDAIFAEVTRLGLEGRVKFTGFVDDVDLPALYSASTLFVYPSLYEGFGLPVLEAMACGIPTIASNLSSIPEVVGSAGLLIDPLDINAIAAAIIVLLKDMSARDVYRQAGIQRAAHFTWEAAAKQLLSIYAEMSSR